MSKERLEEIKKNIKMHMEWAKGTHYAEITEEELKDYEWLIKQAERVHELKEENISLKAIKAGNEELIKMLEQQNKRYREVINNINEKAMLYGVDEQVFEVIREAIKALEGEK